MKSIVAILLVLMMFVLCVAGLSLLEQRLSNIRNTGRIRTVGIDVFEDYNKTVPCVELDWGFVAPGDTVNRIVWVVNPGNAAAVLRFNTSDYVPAGTINYTSLVWTGDGATAFPNVILETTFMLHVFSNVSGIDEFSFNITAWAE